MQQAVKWYRAQTQPGDGRIPALDGVRAAMVLVIAAFHIWQQSWLTPSFSWFGKRISLDFLMRSGYLWVDGLLLLSGFLLYVPYAQARENGARFPAPLTFYRRRFFRIFPTYLLNLLVVLLAVVLPQRLYATAWDGARDVLAHVTFTHNLFAFSYLHTPLNGVLWTLAVEVQFYLLFPWIARAFAKRPLAVYVLMAGAAFAFRAWAAARTDTSLYFNQLPAFLDVYANGMVTAAIYVSLRRRLKEDTYSRILMSVCAAVAIYLLIQLCYAQAAEAGGEAVRLGQMKRRYVLSALIALLMLGVSLGLGGIRLALGNPLGRFLSDISLQFYMWHQVLAVQLRHWRIPPSASLHPNQDGDIVWQRAYVLLCYIGALAIAAAITYLVEQPIARRFSKPSALRRK